jgi:XisI protein
MDKVIKYQNVLLQFLEYYNQETDANNSKEEPQRRIIADKINNSFQLLSIGWHKNHYIFGPIFHFDIINEKIWMQCNNTEWEVVDYLMENGVEKNDIVLGFVPPQARHFSGFAVA